MDLPAIARALLSHLLPEDERDAAIGDLDEELRTRVLPRRGRAGAALWYLREAGSLLASYLWDRCRGAPAPDPHRGPRRDDGGTTMETMRDALHATRVIRREPLVSLVVILTLALGIGANAAIFSVVNAALLRELPYPSADRLARIFNGFEGSDGAFALSPLDWRDVESRPDLVEAVGVYGETSYHLTIDGREARRLQVARTSPGLLDLLGFRAALGRGFRPEEAEPGRHRSVILSHRLWSAAFGADPGIVGRTITLDGESYQVVGVAPSDFRVPLHADVWVPLALEADVWYAPERRGWEFLHAYGRLADGVTPEVAARGLTARLAEAAPDRVTDHGQHLMVRDLREHRVGDTGRALTLLLAAVGFVLLIACANLVNLLLARAEARTREFAIRRALGAGTASVARLVFLETLVLAGAGGLAGLVLARGILALLARLEVEALAPFGRISVDPGVLAFTALVTSVTALLFGLGPALRASRADPQGVLRESGIRSGSSRRAGRLRSGLVALQVALALILLVGLGDSLRSFRRLTATDPGFRPGGVLAVSLELPASGLEAVERAELYRGLLNRVDALPDVESAGLVNFLPLDGRRWSASFELVDPPPSMEGVDLGGNMRAASPDYFRTMGIRLLEGRTFTEADGGGGAPVAVVDERVAREAWPGGSPVGRRIVLGALTSERPTTVVGVVESVKDEGLHVPGNGHVYFPVLQRPMRAMVLVLRTGRAEPVSLAAAVRRIVTELDPRIPVYRIEDLEDHTAASVAGRRLALLLLGGFAAASVLLAGVGIFGVLSYAVARRTGEIGTRIALGADPSRVVWMVVRQVMAMWLVGAAAGVAGALALGSTLRSVLYGIDPAGPVPLMATAAGLGIVALLAALVPARRAASVDCVEALRAE